jgi:uncharacterized protein (TIGR00266 family)
MQIEVLYRPSYSMARVILKEAEVLRAETGAMVGMKGVQVETRMQGGFLRALARSAFANESFFINTFRAGLDGGELLLAPTLPGDVFSLELKQEAFMVQSGSFLASSEGVETDTKWSGARTFFSGEGFIMLRCSGEGTLLLSSYGAIHELTLVEGETFTVDTGHLVAFSEKVGFELRTVGGLKSTLLGGEGLVVDLRGPGKVMLQTRSEGAFLDWLLPKLPKPEAK